MSLFFPTRRLFILIVDEDQAAAQRLAVEVRAQRHEVFIAHNEDQAERTLLVHPCEVILIDANLSGGDGHGVAERLCVPMRKRPLLIGVTNQCLSPGGSSSDGFAHHIQKPIDVGELVKLLLNRAVGAGAGSLKAAASE